MVFQEPFPGPGHAVRILGEVTKERLAKQKIADSILLEEMKKAGWYEKSISMLDNTYRYK